MHYQQMQISMKMQNAQKRTIETARTYLGQDTKQQLAIPSIESEQFKLSIHSYRLTFTGALIHTSVLFNACPSVRPCYFIAAAATFVVVNQRKRKMRCIECNYFINAATKETLSIAVGFLHIHIYFGILIYMQITKPIQRAAFGS